ncbi:hypothetical protein KEM54_003365 [Ascosphaera aggregata]|nr:hypothetical protein KEM54_003365 [Ascosphaera aggregata]
MVLSSASTSISNQSTAGSHTSQASQPSSRPPPVIEQQGRLWIGDPTNAYPLPCDPLEVARQIMHLECLSECFGNVFCNTELKEKPPSRVLEVACGAAVWTQKCYRYYKEKGVTDIEFYGIDVIDIAPDLKKQGINWTFRHADLRTLKIPFPLQHFDFIFIKDASYIRALVPSRLGIWLRYLRPGGVIEIWETDHVFRTLSPHPPPAPGLPQEYYDQANKTRTYTISASTPWTEAKNRFLVDYNRWIRTIFESQKLTTTPCSSVGLAFSTEAGGLTNMGSRRLAIPLGIMPWETEGDSPPLTELQITLRTIVLFSTTRVMRSMDRSLIDASQKTPEEWFRWWTQFGSSLADIRGITTGECLESGAWWGTKKASAEETS